MMPGSTMKIVTAAAAAEVLGWQHQFETTVVTAAPIENGTLRGDLIVVGGGDPSISERSDVPGTLRALAGQLHAAGIARIEGGIVGNDDLLDDRGFGDGWTLDNLPYGYSAPVSALQVQRRVRRSRRPGWSGSRRSGGGRGSPRRQRSADRQPAGHRCRIGYRRAHASSPARLAAVKDSTGRFPPARRRSYAPRRSTTRRGFLSPLCGTRSKPKASR